jgi:peroxiredoxin
MNIATYSFQKIFLTLFAIFAFVILSCKQSVKDIGKTGKAENAFVPVPQKIEKHNVKTLSIGEKAPFFRLPDVSGKFFELDDFKKAQILVVIFTCNHCPTAQAYEDRIISFTKEYAKKDVAVVAIMPNSVYTLLPEECGYSDLDDSYESMKIRAKDKQFNFPYLYDGDNQLVSIQYGPTATPHAFVFDKKRKLIYKGRLDPSEKPGTGNAEDLRSAVDSALIGKPVKYPDNKAFGCSIKWSWKSEWTDKVNKEWMEKPVELITIDQKGIKELLKNDADKLRLINIWATWCAPCVIELPELVNLHRMYGNRDFEFVTVSVDKPEKYNDVLKFLVQKHAPVKNYLFNATDKYALINIIDHEWNGALPYTMLIEPGGKVVYTYQGSVDMLELKRKIIENPLLGRYY